MTPWPFWASRAVLCRNAPLPDCSLARPNSAAAGRGNTFWGVSVPLVQNHCAVHLKRMNPKVARWAKASGVDFRLSTFHSLRHRHASEFLRSRIGTPHALQFRLSHSTIKTAEDSGLLSAEEV